MVLLLVDVVELDAVDVVLDDALVVDVVELVADGAALLVLVLAVVLLDAVLAEVRLAGRVTASSGMVTLEPATQVTSLK